MHPLHNEHDHSSAPLESEIWHRTSRNFASDRRHFYLLSAHSVRFRHHIARSLKYRSMSGTMSVAKFPIPSWLMYFFARGLVRTIPVPTTTSATPPSMSSVSLFAPFSCSPR